jgi:hypothetical protein
MNKEILEEFVAKAKELSSHGCTGEDAMLIILNDNGIEGHIIIQGQSNSLIMSLTSEMLDNHDLYKIVQLSMKYTDKAKERIKIQES